MEAENKDYGTTGSAFDVMDEFTLEQAAGALVFARTGRYVPALPTALTPIGKAYHDWLNVLKAAIYSDPPDHLQASVYEGDKTKTIYLLRDDFRRWCERRGMKPAFLFSTLDAAPKFGSVSQAAPATPKASETPGDVRTWIERAIALANEIGCKDWEAGKREINPSSVCERVSVRMWNDQSTHGKRGPRVAGAIRTTALKGWKFDVCQCTNGMNGSNEKPP